MDTTVEVLRLIGAGAFSALAVITFRSWRRRGGQAPAWAAATFGTLASVAIAGQFFPDEPEDGGWLFATKVLLAVLALFPYLLYRFAVTFQRASTAMETVAGGLTALVAGWSLLLPSLPAPDEPRPSWLTAYVAALVVQWSVLFVVVSVRLWRAGDGQPTVARRRMRLLAFGAAGMAVTIIIAGVAPSSDQAGGVRIVTQLGSLLMALAFFLGFAPPRVLRVSWRQPESQALQGAVAELMTVTTADEVASVILPHTSRILGARGAALLDRTGRVVAVWGIEPEEAQRGGGDEDGRITLGVRNGTLSVWASPYTPYFGDEEVGLLRSLGGLADLALERAAIFARERAFIANAAHELRTPLAALTGLTSTLTGRRGQMTDEQLGQVLDAMERQGARAASLVDRMLDLSFIEHTRITLEDVPLAQAAKRALEAVPSPEGCAVEMTIDDALAARAEPERLEQVLINLLTNAYRYGAPPVVISAGIIGGNIEIEVADSGPGVDPEMTQTMFDPFTRGSSDGAPGSGLGLAIARRFVEAFGGTLRYQPGEPSGARFVIALRNASEEVVG